MAMVVVNHHSPGKPQVKRLALFGECCEEVCELSSQVFHLNSVWLIVSSEVPYLCRSQLHEVLRSHPVSIQSSLQSSRSSVEEMDHDEESRDEAESSQSERANQIALSTDSVGLKRVFLLATCLHRIFLLRLE